MSFYPYPVLGDADSYPTESFFTHTTSHENPGNGFISLMIDHELQGADTLLELVSQQRAMYSVQLIRKDNLFMKTESGYERKITIKIPTYELGMESFQLVSRIISTDKQKFLATDASDELKREYDLAPASLLAVTRSDLEIGSEAWHIMEIINGGTAPLSTNFDTDMIRVSMPEEMYRSYTGLMDHIQNEHINPTVELGVIVEALAMMKDLNEYDKEWQNKLEHWLADKGYSKDDLKCCSLFEMANAVLSDVLSRKVDDIMREYNGGEPDESL